MSGVEEMPLGRRSYLRCLLGEGHGRWEAAAACGWPALLCVWFQAWPCTGQALYLGGSGLKHLLEGRWESTEKGPFAKGRGSHPLARAWLRSEPLLLGWCEGPRKEADQGAG